MKSMIYATTFGLTLLAGCATTVQPGDKTPPKLTVLDISNRNAVVYSTDTTTTPAPLACDNGAAPFGLEPAGQSDNVYYLLPVGDDSAKLLVSFSDPSGIKSAEVLIEAEFFTVTDPDLPIVTIGPDSREFYAWRFTQTGQLRTAKPVTLDIEVRDTFLRPPLTTISYRSEDGAGNTDTGFFFLNKQDQAC